MGLSGRRVQARWPGPEGERLGWGQGPFLTADHIRRLIPQAVHRCLSGAALIPPLRI